MRHVVVGRLEHLELQVVLDCQLGRTERGHTQQGRDVGLARRCGLLGNGPGAGVVVVVVIVGIGIGAARGGVADGAAAAF